MSKAVKIGVAAAIAVAVTAAAATTAVLVIKKKKKETETTTEGSSQTTTTETTTTETSTESVAVPDMKDVAIKSGTYLSMWNSSLACSTTKVGDSETFDVVKSSSVSGAYYIQNKQGRYLSCNSDGILSVSPVAGTAESWFIKNATLTGLIQSYDGYYLSKDALSSQTSKATKATGDYFTIVAVSSISDTPVVVPSPSYRICAFSVTTQMGVFYMTISSAGWVSCDATTIGTNERFYLVPAGSGGSFYYVCTMDGRYLVGDQNGKLGVLSTQNEWGIWSVGNLGAAQGGQIYSQKGRYNLVCDESDGSMKTSAVVMGDFAHTTFKSTVISS